MARTLDMKAYKVAELVKKGLPVRSAMIKAGYSEGYANNPNRNAMISLIDNAKQKYLASFMTGLDKNKLTGERIVDRLAKTINGKDDFNSTSAIKVLNSVMLNSLEKTTGITVNANIVIPAVVPNNGWDGNGQGFNKVIDVPKGSKNE